MLHTMFGRWLIAAIAWAIFSASHVAVAACTDRVVLAPPPVDDWKLAVWLSSEVSQAVLKQEKDPCWLILPYRKTSAAFDMVGSTTSFPRDPTELGPRQLKFLVSHVAATHVLFMAAPDDDGLVVARLFAISEKWRLTAAKVYRIALKPKSIDEHRAGVLPRLFAKLAPNSVMAGFTKTDVYFDVNAAYSERKITTHGTIPPLLSSFAVTRVEHRRGFGLFDYAGSIFPGQYFFGIDQDNSYRRKPEFAGNPAYPEALDLHIETYGACGSFNAQASLFSPIGTTSVGVGWGPCLLWLRTRDRDAVWYVRTAMRFFMGHRVFISDQFFLSLDWDSLVFDKALHKSPFANAEQVERVGFALGWYVPDSEEWASRLWNFLL